MNESKDSIELQDKIAYLKGARIIKTLQDVANKTDYSKGTVSAYVSGKTRPSKDFLTKFEDSYPELKNFVMGGQLTYQQKRHENKLNGNREDVPVYNGSTTLGNITLFSDENKEQIATLPQTVFPGCDYAEKASGDSMYPLIMNQALLVGRKCPPAGLTYCL